MSESYYDTIDTAKLSSAEGFAELLAAAEQGETEQGGEDGLQEEETNQEEVEEEGEEEEVEAAEEDDYCDLDPKEARSVKYFKDRATAAEAEAMELRQWKEQMTQALMSMQQPQQEQAEEWEPLDEEADKRYNSEITKLRQQQKQAEFRQALQYADIQANQKYSDFNNAYQHIQKQKAEEISAITGVTTEQANHQAMLFMQQVALSAFEKGRNIGDTFYSLAQKTGYAAQAAPKKGLNPAAIEKNRSKTEKKPVKSASIDDLSGQDPWSLIQKISKPGVGVDKEAFAKLLSKAHG